MRSAVTGADLIRRWHRSVDDYFDPERGHEEVIMDIDDALADAHAAGRREGVLEAAGICVDRADWYRSQRDHFGVRACQDCANDIHKLATSTDGAKESDHGE